MSQTLKNKLIKNIQQIPEDLLIKIYCLDIIGSKGKMQWDLWIAHKYQKYQKPSYNEIGLHLNLEIGES